MNYGELKTFILADAHRTDLSETGDTGAVGFIRRAEGMIRRELIGYDLTATLDEDDRSSNGIYDLPSGVAQIRTITGTYSGEEYELDEVGLSSIKNLPDTVVPQIYAVHANTVEFRGVPATDAEFTVNYFGQPTAFSDDADENDLLTDHEIIYVSAAKFYLYTHTQDRELAKDEFDLFRDAVEKLNEAKARKVGGGGSIGGYNLGNFRVGSAY